MSQSPTESEFWEVAINAPLNRLFTYGAPNESSVAPGDSVEVPFGSGNRKAKGLVIRPIAKAPEGFAVKKILSPILDRPQLSNEMLSWL